MSLPLAFPVGTLREGTCQQPGGKQHQKPGCRNLDLGLPGNGKIHVCFSGLNILLGQSELTGTLA